MELGIVALCILILGFVVLFQLPENVSLEKPHRPKFQPLSGVSFGNLKRIDSAPLKHAVKQRWLRECDLCGHRVSTCGDNKTNTLLKYIPIEHF